MPAPACYVIAAPESLEETTPKAWTQCLVNCPKCSRKVGKGLRFNDVADDAHEYPDFCSIYQVLGERLSAHLGQCKSYKWLDREACAKLCRSASVIWYDANTDCNIHGEEGWLQVVNHRNAQKRLNMRMQEAPKTPPKVVFGAPKT